MTRRAIPFVALCFLSVAAATVAGSLAEWSLDGSDVGADDGFGFSVGASRDTIVVGSLRDDEKGELAGAAYVFERDGMQWNETAKLTGSDLDGNDVFGRAVAVDGKTIVVGADAEDSIAPDAGAAYVFRRRPNGTWKEVAKLTATDGIAEEGMGLSVAVQGKRIAVGVPGFEGGGLTAGRVLVFRKQGRSWNLEGEVVAKDGKIDDGFGFAVAIHRKTLIVGAPFRKGRGAAYVFRYGPGPDGDRWRQEARIAPGSLTDGVSFGASVATDGNVAVAGAYKQRVSDARPGGAVFVYRHVVARGASAWKLAQTLTGSEGGGWFGGAVAMRGKRLAVGARLGQGNGGYPGAAYQFNYRKKAGEWVEQAKFVPSDGSTSGQAGFSVGVGRGFLVFGAPGFDPGGRAYVADLQ